jgi:hypothetical protein
MSFHLLIVFKGAKIRGYAEMPATELHERKFLKKGGKKGSILKRI